MGAKWSATKNLLGATNLSFLAAGIYFLVAGVLREGTVYSVIGAALCFIAFLLGTRTDLYYSPPWRLATAAFSIVMFISQIFADSYVVTWRSYYVLGSLFLNGAFFFLFIGVLLYAGKELIEQRKPEEESEEASEVEKKTEVIQQRA